MEKEKVNQMNNDEIDLACCNIVISNDQVRDVAKADSLFDC